MELSEHDIPTELGLIRIRIGGLDGAPTMLFWPSLLMDGRMWSAQAEHFGDRYRVVVVDPPGHGGSERLTAPFDFATCAGVIVSLLDKLGIDRVHHVGNSWGAMIGVTLAAHHPDRVASAVLMNGTSSPAGPLQRGEYAVLLRGVRLFGFRGPFVRAAVDAFTGPTSRHTRPQVAAAIRESVAHVDVASVSHAVRSVVPRRPDQRSLLGRIGAPVLVVAGAEDATFPVAETKVMADGIAGAQFVVLDDAAHLAALEVPDRVNALIDGFLTRLT